MLQRILQLWDPYYTWPVTKRKTISTTLPPVPQLSHWLVRRFWGFVHRRLVDFSIWYCKNVGIKFSRQICPLPFGLLLKWSDGTRHEEVIATQLARRAGLPTPKIICYGDQPHASHAPVSILMTRMPGEEIWEELWDWYDQETKDTIISELKLYLDTIRSWNSPFPNRNKICSVIGTAIRSVRVPLHSIGPCENEMEFNKALLEYSAGSDEDFKKAKARKSNHSIKYTHGDFFPWNVLVEDGHVSAILDWECSGWYPEYWEVTTAMRNNEPGNWWYDIIEQIGEGKYHEERIGDRAVRLLTQDSMGL